METGKLFLGSKSECKVFLKSRTGYYVYVLRRPDGRPFYVGKGSTSRILNHENEARHVNDRRSNAYKLNVIRSILSAGLGISYEIDSCHGTEASAHERETQLIKAIGRLHEGGPLTNLAPGGGSERGPAPASRAKHQATLSGSPGDNPERAVINAFVNNISRMNSVVIKPSRQFVARQTQSYPNKSMNASVRQAVAISASAASNGILLGADCIIPRKVVVEGIDGLIENGVSCDIVTSGLGSLIAAEHPSDESFHLSSRQADAVIDLIGRQKCIDLGILRPPAEAARQ
ncbi:hypothetical protein BHAOGJBA_1177 [Methylobacterium hispanicum]|uniref:GIY-YIG domain-containing protein n=1 Tax=Methylobacterium hispanicum TaxID=270350 RepID=A0AAV4ZHI9_9HYPH|nr:GIY-YIG nuclease family protein [Methylobacterium hispanicum]GJD87672.1 hypothetical protein BHAOGJBA_1177 [Methylobacterium hispanicum]